MRSQRRRPRRGTRVFAPRHRHRHRAAAASTAAAWRLPGATAVVVWVLVLVSIGSAQIAGAAFRGTTGTPSNTFSTGSFYGYREAVKVDSPLFYYRLNEATGVTATDSGAGARNGRYQVGYEFGVAGATGDGDTALRLPGAPQLRPVVSAAATVANPNPMTVEFWFRSSSSTGGVLVSFGSNPAFDSTTSDRLVSLYNDGRVAFTVKVAGTTWTSVTSASGFNDGNWHHVAASLGAVYGMRLYVDGSLRSSSAASKTGISMTGYWRVGGESAVNTSVPPNDSYPSADVDEFAVYTSEILPTAVSTHYGARNTGYATVVLAASPYLFWRFNETNMSAGTADATGNGRTGVFSEKAAVPTAAAGVNVNTGNAAQFTGLKSYIVSSKSVGSPNVFTAELLFNTTSVTGGRLFGLGDLMAGTTSEHDRALYMLPDGKLSFTVWPSYTQKTITSAASYNDGTWHQAVISLGVAAPAGMRLYVDGAQVASDPATTTGLGYAGYWRVGRDTLQEFTNRPTEEFTGRIDEVSVYPTNLAAAKVLNHYNTIANATYPTTVTTDGATLYWRFNESDYTSGAAGSSGSGNIGAPVADPPLTYQVSGAMTGGQGRSPGVRFTGQSSVWYPTQQTNPTVFSLEFWTRTTTTNGGFIVGFGDAKDAISSYRDRMVYMGNDGRLHFGIGSNVVASTAGSYNDGNWHHVVATLGGGGMTLYVDNVVRATNASTTPQNYNGYWRVAGERLGGWSNVPSAGYYSGDLAELAVYTTTLSAARVSAHYTANA